MNLDVLTDKSTIGERVKYYRQKRNITQKQLAIWANCSVSTISRLENHNYIPSVNILLSVCNELGVPPVFIFKSSSRLSVMYMCIPGKTKIDSKGRMKGFELVNVSYDFKIDKSECFCVMHDDKIYFASKHLDAESDLVLYLSKETGDCYVGKADLNNSKISNCCPIARLLYDITDLTAYVTGV